MSTFIVLVFIIGYIAITLEHQIKLDKLIPALLMMALAWAGIAVGIDGFTSWFDPHESSLMDISSFSHENKLHLMESTLLHHFGKTSEILIFLMGAMTIVEMIDHFQGFNAIKKMIKTKNKKTLLWIICFLAFFLSAIIDNLTATIVLITILRKIIHDSKDRMWYAGFIIIAANAGGAWTPIGDVTTTMLWMAGKVSTGKLIMLLGIPSLINILIPLIIGSFLNVFKGNVGGTEETVQERKYSSLMLYLGLILIVFVPVFKTITHLPPYIGMMLSLSIFAIIAELISKRSFSLTDVTDTSHGHATSPTLRALGKIEMPSVLFFLGILMTVASLESLGLIFNFGQVVNASISQNLFVTLLGVSSAIIDNVPLVAASIGMFQEVPDANVWHFIAYAAGTGGSMLIIGSAAGVVAMGMEKISFGWYLKNITLLAFLGYLCGIGAFILMA
ncbi:MAG: sodium:proton antiporter NhaD [Flavobacteriia bacterium]|nr:sodium:proton antiporter NhaD [Flavobacteriia bacterium]